MTKSEMLLSRLVEERLTPNADVAEIDRRIRALFDEEWCVVFLDATGRARGAPDEDTIATLTMVHELRRLSRPVVEAAGGFSLRSAGTSALVLFRHAQDGLNSVLQLHRALAGHNQSRPAERHLHVGAGLGFGRVLKIGDADVFGAEVTAASRLGVLAQAGDTLVSDAARAALMHHPDVELEAYDNGQGFAAFQVRKIER